MTGLPNFNSGTLILLTILLALVVSVLSLQAAQEPPPRPNANQTDGSKRGLGNPNVEDNLRQREGNIRLDQQDGQGELRGDAAVLTIDVDQDVSILTRGPLHESFATVYLADPQPGIKIDQEPPQPIDEQPPSYRPEGRNVSWIPGYWEWDEETTDFIWISGIWRDVPPQQQWVPGYWHALNNGYRRVTGFWISEKTEELVYLPPPPQSVERGPSAPAPDPNHIYIPGAWQYHDNQYVWRSGFWTPARENWIWIPDQYVWTPSGVLFAPGYWDYELQYRGIVFAPVRFMAPIHSNPGYIYTPEYVIDSDLNLLVHLFHRPNRYHYYFGDYYASRYRDEYRPWIATATTQTYYDPLFTYYNVPFENGSVNLIDWVQRRHGFYAENENLRPPRTLREQVEFYNAAKTANVASEVIRLSTFGMSIADLGQTEDTSYPFSQLSDDQRREFLNSREPFRALSRGRAEIEGQARDLARDFQQRPNQRSDQRRDRELGGQDQPRREGAADRPESRRLDQARQTGGVRRVDETTATDRSGARLRLQDFQQNLRDNMRDRTRDLRGRAGEELQLQRDLTRQQFNDALRGRPSRPNDWPTMRQTRDLHQRLNIPATPRTPGSTNPSPIPR